MLQKNLPYGNRFLIKPTKSATLLMQNAEYESPYEGAGKMLLVDDVDNKDSMSPSIEKDIKELLEIMK